LQLAVAERSRRRLVATFGRYLSPAVLRKVLERGIEPRAERKTVTILFSDIASFSSFCDRVEPEQVHQLLTEYLEEMVACVFAEEGTVDKFIGDGVLAFFGDPLEQPDHAKRAVRAGLNMLKRVESLNDRWKSQDRSPIAIRIGINTGPAVVGNVGAVQRVEYTVLGDTVNRAQRLEAASRTGCLLMGKQTWEQVDQAFPEARAVGQVAGKRAERYAAWELAGPNPGQDKTPASQEN
jgi:adenylate cyclase